MTSTQGGNQFRSGITLLPAHYEVIDRLLDELMQKIPAHFVLLTDVTGQVVSARGEQSQVDLVVLGSLIAGDLAASQEIGRVTGEYQSYQMVLREGQRFYTFIAEAGNHLALLVQVSNEVPLGWARMLIQAVGQRLAEVMIMPAQELEPFGLEEPDDLAGLFDHALDDMWME